MTWEPGNELGTLGSPAGLFVRHSREFPARAEWAESAGCCVSGNRTVAGSIFVGGMSGLLAKVAMERRTKPSLGTQSHTEPIKGFGACRNEADDTIAPVIRH